MKVVSYSDLRLLEQRLEVQEEYDRKPEQLKHKMEKLKSTNRDLRGDDRINVDAETGENR